MPFRNSVVGGVTLVRPAIRSPNYDPGLAGWSIDIDGSAEFNDVTVRGTLESSNYVPGVSGWRLDQAGSAEFYDVLVRGAASGDVVVVGPPTLPQVSIGSTPTSGYVRWTTNRPSEGRPSEIVGGVGNSGAANEYSALVMAGPAQTGAANDHVRLLVRSQPANGSAEAMVQALHFDGVSTLTEYFQLAKSYMYLIGPRLIVQPEPSGNSAVFVSLDGAHTGRAIHVQVGGSTILEVHNDGTVDLTGELSAPNIQSGSFSIMPTVANEWTANTGVVFPTPFVTTPVVMLTCTSGAPGSATTTELEYAAASVTTTGFNARIRRGNLTNTTLSWLAISTP
jgi:hypothetical protein